jgi:hypothetical protein
MFIQIKSKEGDISWINLKQVLVITLGRPTDGWIWGFLYRNDTLWSETFKSKEEADQWLEDALKNCRIPVASDIG